METFRRQFLIDSIKNLKNLENELANAKKFSDSERREIFRTIHTLKGSAQTLGFVVAGQIAHELENLFSADQIIDDENFQTVFSEGIKLLTNALEKPDFELSASFTEKVHRIIPANLQSQLSSGLSLLKIPEEIVGHFSQTEKFAVDSAMKAGKSIYCFAVDFNAADFVNDLIKCRETLTDICEIIATFPGAKLNPSDKIGFRLICASSAKKARIEEIAEIYGAKITFDISLQPLEKNLRNIVLTAIAHGKNVAEKLGKDIDFVVSDEDISLSNEQLKLIFDILIHLIRNAVDHGIKNVKGTVEVSLKAEKNNLLIRISDDGNGINLEKLKTKAIEKRIISRDEMLTEQATLDLIFQSELSTASKITEISGRGIGLDAVKNSVEKFGGTIKVMNQIKNGTIFEVFLPL